MATAKETRRQRRPYLYIAEHIDASGKTDQELADKLGHSRVTVWRWRTDQRKLTIDRQIALAEALGIEPEELWHPPHRRSLDALLKYADDEQCAIAFDIVSRLTRRTS